MAFLSRVPFAVCRAAAPVCTRALRPSAVALLSRKFSAAASLVDVDGSRHRDGIEITSRCAQRISQVKPNGFLRLKVDGGGCSGFKYKFELADGLDADDQVFERDGAKLVIDTVSLEMVRGAKVDFVEEMISSSFQIVENPKSDSSCGCGASFSPKS